MLKGSLCSWSQESKTVTEHLRRNSEKWKLFSSQPQATHIAVLFVLVNKYECSKRNKITEAFKSKCIQSLKVKPEAQFLHGVT